MGPRLVACTIAAAALALACSSKTTNIADDGGAGASGGGGSGGADSGGAGSGGAAGVPAVGPVSDEFDVGAQPGSHWQVYNTGAIESIDVFDSQLRVIPLMSMWYLDMQGIQVFQEVEGDFRVSTTVHVRNREGTALTAGPTHWAGVMARSPDVSVDWINLTIGHDALGEPFQSLEHVSTDGGITDYDNFEWSGAGDAELRICRTGTTFQLYAREAGAASWALQATYVRPDLPATLLVGPSVHANSLDTDLRATFEHVRFAPIATADDCTAD